MKADRNKIDIEMAKKKWSVPQLAKAYGVRAGCARGSQSVCRKRFADFDR